MTELAVQRRDRQCDRESLAGKYLIFGLGEEQYGVEILKIREIIGYVAVTKVPQAPADVLGVINLRGKVIPVVDLRGKFGLPPAERDEENCIIVTEIERGGAPTHCGVLVDRVREVLDISAGQIEPPPDFGEDVDTRYLLGMAQAGDELKTLLAIEEVLGGTMLGEFVEEADEQA